MTKTGPRLTKLNQQFVDAELQDWRDQRHEWADRLAEAREMNVPAIEKLNSKIPKLMKRRDALRDELKIAERELSKVRSAIGGLARQRDSEISKCEGKLRESVSPRHRELCEEVERQIVEIQGVSPIRIHGEKRIDGWRQVLSNHEDIAAVARWLMTSVRTEVAGLALEDLDDDELEIRFHDIMKNRPAIRDHAELSQGL